MPHHIVFRGNNRRCLFSYRKECLQFTTLLAKALCRYNCTLNAFALMKNHVHLLVVPTFDDSLARLCHFVCQQYARHRNLSRKGSGKLFEERFWSNVILDDSYLGAATVYIDSNPLRAGIDASSYWAGWSSLGLHTKSDRVHSSIAKLWTPSPWYLSLGINSATRARAYESFFDLKRNCVLDHPKLRTIEEKLATRLPTDRRRYERPDRSQAI
ncbi:MAG: transposase [Myxococcales bacterium]|nr:MAG: transposase [Myxococcales bacterium]